MEIFWLFLLGTITYIIVRQSVANITRTPVWILWLVIMLPAFVWTSWIVINGENEPFPLPLLIGLFITCPILYWVLIQWGRPTRPSESPQIRKPEIPIAAIPAEKSPDIIRPIDKGEEATLKACFPWSIFYLKSIEYRPQALICRGHLRTSPDNAYKTIRTNVESKFGDRFLVIFQEGMDGKPFFALAPNPRAHLTQASTTTLTRPGLALALLAATILTTTFAGVLIAEAQSEEIQVGWSNILTGLPYALSLLAILGVHEMGHYLTARRHRISVTFPYFIPVPWAPIFPFGTFGAFIQMRSPVPNRKALFDVGIASPLCGFLVTIPVLMWGLAHSALTPLTDDSGILNFQSFRPSASLLLMLLSKRALGGTLTIDSAIDLHPVAIAGCLGVVVTALNLMPVGQLDGGHIVHAMFGQRTGAMIGQIARFLVLGLSFVQREFFFWAILLFFIPVVDEPTLNDVTELDNTRDLLGLLALAVLVMIVLPAPATLMQLLF
jgi:membrane-associated protease RseP (regulator of RpoE activity)